MLSSTIPLGSDVADSPSRGVKEEVEVFGIVGVHKSGLERREIREENPIPRSHQNILRLYVAVADLIIRVARDTTVFLSFSTR